MPVKIKREEVVNEDVGNNNFPTDRVSDDECSRLRSENEHLRILLTFHKKENGEQHSKIVELTEKIDNLERQLILMKNRNEENTNIISEKNKYLSTIYDSMNNLETKSEPVFVTDPKSATLRLNQYYYLSKDLKNKITDSKILIMSLCKILGCENGKLIQSMKDIINENEINKNKYKIYEKFYQHSKALTTSVGADLHRNGYEKHPATASNVCEVHTESFGHWTKKMANTRYQLLQNKERKSWLTPTYVPLKNDTRYQSPGKIFSSGQNFQTNQSMPNQLVQINVPQNNPNYYSNQRFQCPPDQKFHNDYVRFCPSTSQNVVTNTYHNSSFRPNSPNSRSSVITQFLKSPNSNINLKRLIETDLTFQDDQSSQKKYLSNHDAQSYAKYNDTNSPHNDRNHYFVAGNI